METERYKLDEQLYLSESYRRVALLGENSTTVANPKELVGLVMGGLFLAKTGTLARSVKNQPQMVSSTDMRKISALRTANFKTPSNTL